MGIINHTRLLSDLSKEIGNIQSVISLMRMQCEAAITELEEELDDFPEGSERSDQYKYKLSLQYRYANILTLLDNLSD